MSSSFFGAPPSRIFSNFFLMVSRTTVFFGSIPYRSINRFVNPRKRSSISLGSTFPSPFLSARRSISDGSTRFIQSSRPPPLPLSSRPLSSPPRPHGDCAPKDVVSMKSSVYERMILSDPSGKAERNSIAIGSVSEKGGNFQYKR